MPSALAMAYGVSSFLCSLSDLLAHFNPKLRPTDFDTVGLCAGHTGFRTVMIESP
jgi:hypothetical protein